MSRPASARPGHGRGRRPAAAARSRSGSRLYAERGRRASRRRRGPPRRARSRCCRAATRGAAARAALAVARAPHAHRRPRPPGDGPRPPAAGPLGASARGPPRRTRSPRRSAPALRRFVAAPCAAGDRRGLRPPPASPAPPAPPRRRAGCRATRFRRAAVLGSARDAVPGRARRSPAALRGGARGGAVLAVAGARRGAAAAALGTPGAAGLVANLPARGLRPSPAAASPGWRSRSDELALARRAAVPSTCRRSSRSPARTSALDALLAEQDQSWSSSPRRRPLAGSLVAGSSRACGMERSAPARAARRGPARAPTARRAAGAAAEVRCRHERGERGQASILLVGGLVAVVLGALVLGLVARGGGPRGARAARGGSRRARRGAGDARRLPAAVRARDARPRPPPRHLDKREYLALGRARRAAVAGPTAPRRRGRVPRRVDVRAGARPRRRARPLQSPHRRRRRTARDRGERRGGARRPPGELGRPAAATTGRSRPPGRADAPGRRARVRPHGARRPRATASTLIDHRAPSGPTPSRRSCSPATRTRAGSRRPAARCTASAPSSTSARRAAYGWLAAQRAALPLPPALRRGSRGTSATRSTPARRPRRGARRRGRSALPSFVPARFAPALARAAQRWNVSAALLAAQLYAESNFNPFAVSPRARRGSRSSCPARRARSGSTTRSTPSRRSTPRRT